MAGRRRVLPALMIAVAIMAGSSREAQAQSVNLNSSMQASCLNAACDIIKFVLLVPNQVRNSISYTNPLVNTISIFALRPLFEFGSVLGVWNGGGSLIPGTWSSTIDTSDPFATSVEVAIAGGNYESEPIWLEIAMNTADASNLFSPGALTYTANGQVWNGTGPEHFSTGGQVTPEPISMVLMGTGLLGLGAARRRKRLEIESA